MDIIALAELVTGETGDTGCPVCKNINWDIRREKIPKLCRTTDRYIVVDGDYDVDINKDRLNISCECNQCGALFTLRYKLEDGILEDDE